MLANDDDVIQGFSGTTVKSMTNRLKHLIDDEFLLVTLISC